MDKKGPACLPGYNGCMSRKGRGSFGNGSRSTSRNGQGSNRGKPMLCTVKKGKGHQGLVLEKVYGGGERRTRRRGSGILIR